MSSVRKQLSKPPIENLSVFEIKTICELEYATDEDISVSENESNNNVLNKIDDETLQLNEEEESDDTAALNPEEEENEESSEDAASEDEIGLNKMVSHRMSFVSHKKNDSLFVFEGKNDFLILGIFFLLIAFFLIGGFYLNSN